MSRAFISPQRLYEQVQYMLLAFFLVWYHAVRTQSSQRQATVPCVGATLTALLATKVVRPRSDRGSGCTGKDQSKETEDRALISAIKFVYQDCTIVLQSRTLVFRLRVWPCKTIITEHLMTSQQQHHAGI